MAADRNLQRNARNRADHAMSVPANPRTPRFQSGTFKENDAVRCIELKDLIIREAGSQTRLLLEQACADAGVAPRQRIEINNRDAFREAVAQGLGIGVIGDRGLVPDQRLHHIVIRDADIRIDRCLACLKERRDSRLIGSFLEFGRSIAKRLDAAESRPQGAP